MASQAGVHLFLQRIFVAKDDVVDGLVRSISRGTGHEYGGKNGFVQEANRVLEDIGYMLVRVVFNGVPYYVLKDLETVTYIADPRYGGSQGASSNINDGDMSPSQSSQSSGTRYTDSLRVLDCKFTPAEVAVYMDAMAHIVRESGYPASTFTSVTAGEPLQLTDVSTAATSWKSLCLRHAVSDNAAQQALADRFQSDGWLVVDTIDGTVIPGVRFHVEFMENYDFSEHPDCVSCGGKIICMSNTCERCGSTCHKACHDILDSGERHTLVYFSENEEAARLVHDLDCCCRYLLLGDGAEPSPGKGAATGGDTAADADGRRSDFIQADAGANTGTSSAYMQSTLQCVVTSRSLSISSAETESQRGKVLSSLVAITSDLEELVGRYMHSPTLLYPHIEALVSTAFDLLRRFVELPFEVWSSVLSCGPSDELRESLIALEFVCYHIYNVAKVVGLRRVIGCAPNEVRFLVPLVVLIEYLQSHVRIGGDMKYDNKRWCMEYVCLAWLSLLVYTPFELSTIWHAGDGSRMTLQGRILGVSMHYLVLSTKARDAAAIVLSTLFARPDVSDVEVGRFMSHCNYVLTSGSSANRPGSTQSTADNKKASGAAAVDDRSNIPVSPSRGSAQPTSAASPDSGDDLFSSPTMPATRIDSADSAGQPAAHDASTAPSSPEKPMAPFGTNDHGQIGVMTVLKQMLKRMSRDDLRLHLPRFTACLLDQGWSPSSSACRKLKAACLGRLAVHLLPPHSSSQRYRRMCRKFMESDSAPEEPESADADFEMDERVEGIVEQLLGTLVDSDIRVRWASAKSIGRISAKLPMCYNDQIIEHVLQIIQNQYDTVRQCFTKGEAPVHGSCLAIAEIIRGGILHPHMLDRVLDCVVLTLDFDVWRGKGSAGTAVRDASCYICWAIVRNFASSLIQPSHLIPMSKSLVNMALFDISINCRRAACAALQELVGRVGNVAHGLDLIVLADYYTVSNRRNAFVNVSFAISKLGFYTISMIDNLMKTKLHHPDITTRRYAATALGRISLALIDSPNSQLATRNGLPVYLEIVEHCLSNVFSTTLGVMHGSLCALTEVLSGLLNHGVLISDQFSSIKQIPVLFERKRLFRLKGGVLIRQSMCRLINFICRIVRLNDCLSISPNELDVYIVIVKDCVRSFTLDVQISAAECLGEIFEMLCIMDYSKATSVMDYLLSSLANHKDNIAARRGYALALGSIPEGLCVANCESLLEALCHEVLNNSGNVAIKDAQTRQHSLISLVRLLKLCAKVKLSGPTIERIVSCLEFGCCDSEVDSRGDVGSWVREVSIEIIAYIFFLKQCQVLQQEEHGILPNLSDEHVQRLVKCLVGVCLEPMDHTRARATFLFAHIFGASFHFKVEWVWQRVFYGARYEYEVARRGTFPVSYMDTASAVEHVSKCLSADELRPTRSDPGLYVRPSDYSSTVRHPLPAVPSCSDICTDSDYVSGIESDYANTDTASHMSQDDYVDCSTVVREAVDPAFKRATFRGVITSYSCGHDRFFDDCAFMSSQEAPVISAIAHNINWQVVHTFDLKELLLSLSSESMEGSDAPPKAQGNVSLRLPGYALSPLCFDQFMWMLYMPSFSSVVMRALFQVLGGMAIQETWNRRTVSDVIIEFIRTHQNKVVRSPHGEWMELHEMLLQYVLEVYREGIRDKNYKLSTRVVSAARTFLLHRLIFPSNDLVDLLARESGTATNYGYLKSIYKCLHAAHSTIRDRRAARTALRAMLGYICHKYPTLRTYARSSLMVILSSYDWGPSTDTLGAALAMLDECVANKGNEEALLLQRLLSLLKL
ncbi:beta-tubulin cofactor D [Babesia ovata]|uniref:Beta-tubulin cofactor D n=1 Tax=Babesia ovata TaxID=189622 RepID=A0A2H6K6E0_9APIC|nr:beta-tubulin cofactor D [Babesia ovata]GBE58563.1 beta-tubulin cofactor D [Babesia ovata]